MTDKQIIAAIATIVQYMKSSMAGDAIDTKMVARSYRAHLQKAGERDEIAEIDAIVDKVRKQKKRGG